MIHSFTMNGYRIITDTESGAVHSVSPAVYDIAAYFKKNTLNEIFNILKSKYDEAEILEGYSELRELVDAGLLFSPGNLPENFKTEPLLKALCLSVAHDCNLECGYCFASKGAYGGEQSLMPFETGKAAIDYLIKESKNRRNLDVDFFGGEPLLNFGVVKKIVEYAENAGKEHNKNFNFTITTNGLLLNDENMEFINLHMSNIVLSIDGRQEVNDRMRKAKNGAGSYNLMADKLVKAAKSRGGREYYARGTFTAQNLDFSKDAVHMRDMGFKHISIEPVVCAGAPEIEITKEHLPRIFDEYENLSKLVIERHEKENSFDFFHFTLDLSGGPCVYKRLSGCGAGNEYLAVTPGGDLYPCHQFIGKDEFLMGNIFTGENKKAQSIKNTFLSCNVLTKEKCRECWAKYYCGGGCAANAVSFNGDIFKPYEIGCETQKKRTECALMIKAAVAHIEKGESLPNERE